MQKVYLDFIEEPLESPRRLQEGIYDFYDISFGELNVINNKSFIFLNKGRRSIRIILLDVRYQKNPEKLDIVTKLYRFFK